MILAIQCIAACLLFTLIVLPKQYKDPVKYIMSYPPAIIRRVESLPQYKDMIQHVKKKHITIKIIVALIFVIVLSFVAFFSGAKSFLSAYYHVFMLFFAVNMYDVIVLDIVIFCHSKKLRIPGTEDMNKEYRNPWFHIIGGLKGIVIGAAVSLLSAVIVQLIPLF